MIVQENLDSQATSSRNRGCKPGPRSTKTMATTVIDLEKEPEGLKDVRYHTEGNCILYTMGRLFKAGLA